MELYTEPPRGSSRTEGTHGYHAYRPPNAHHRKPIMSKAVVDPEELRRFANDLKRFTSELHTQMGSIFGRMSLLSQTWRDQEQQKFAEEFELTMKQLNRFMEAVNIHIPFLLRKAQRVDEYLQQR